MRKYTDKIPVVDMPVAEGNFDSNRMPPIGVVVHTTDGTKEGAFARFNDPNSHVCANYIVDLDGTLYAMLEEYYVAYASGRYSPDPEHPFANQNTLAIEHVDNGNYNDSVRTPAEYNTSAYLISDICQTYNIPIDREHIRKHSEVSLSPTGCPDGLDIDKIIALAQEYASGARVFGQETDTAPVTPAPEAAVTPAPASPVYTQEQYDSCMNDRQKFWTERDAALQQVSDLQHQLADSKGLLSAFQAKGYNTVEDVDKQVLGLTDENRKLKEEVKQVTDSNASILDNYKKELARVSTAVDSGIKSDDLAQQLSTDLNDIAKYISAKPTKTAILTTLDSLLQNQRPTVRAEVKQAVGKGIDAMASSPKNVLQLFGLSK